jgi:DNA-binding Lrp family transcriptional regulator
MCLVEQVLPGLPSHVLELLDLCGHRHQANVRCAVTVHAYVLIQTDVGKAAQVAQQLNSLQGVVVADGVTGPYDVIARAEALSMDDLGRMVVRDMQQIEGITRTITCPVVTI